MLLPTGPGESQISQDRRNAFRWRGVVSRTTSEFCFTGNETGHATRTWMYDLETNKSTPLTPEGTRGTRVSPDGQWFVTVDPHKLLLSPVAGGDSKTIIELQTGESVVRWSGDGRYLFLQQREPASIKISSSGNGHPSQRAVAGHEGPRTGSQFFGPLSLCRRMASLAPLLSSTIWRICFWCVD